MKNINVVWTFTLAFCLCLSGASCSDYLDLQPKDKITQETIFSEPEGVKLYMANLYYQLPIEDFNYSPTNGFYKMDDAGNGARISPMFTDEANHSEWGISIEEGAGDWWEAGYKLNRDVNLMIEAVPSLDISEAEKRLILGEGAFIRAYLYYALVKRYGGVCLIPEVQQYQNGDIESLKVSRSTEKESWDFILQACDEAIANLPPSWDGSERRATKWAAYALKSRVALHAASIAKYGSRAPLSGEAVSQGLVGVDASYADAYYRQCIEASEALINSGAFSLYQPNPATPEEAAANYQAMFEDPNQALCEAIFIKGYMRPGVGTAHNYDIWYNPNQTANGWPHPGRLNPTLDLVDAYENYDTPGVSSPVITTENGRSDDTGGFSPSVNYRRFNAPEDIFKGKDARFFASIIYPNALWKGTQIIIQGGLVKPDGSALIETFDSYQHRGITYYTYGSEASFSHSGFDTYGGNMTRTGFLLRKFLQENTAVAPSWNQSTSDFVDMRYAEVLLNYAEAVVESGYTADNAPAKAAKVMNDIRRRAGHTTDIPLTLENVLRERKVELAFENKRFWDLIRRREFHTEFENRKKLALMPLLDRRGEKPQYIFIRKSVSRDIPVSFQSRSYYQAIPGIATTGIVQNPQY